MNTQKTLVGMPVAHTSRLIREMDIVTQATRIASLYAKTWKGYLNDLDCVLEDRGIKVDTITIK